MLQGDTNGTVVVPEIVCPLDDEALEELQRTLDPMEHSQSHGRDFYTRYLNIVSNQQWHLNLNFLAGYNIALGKNIPLCLLMNQQKKGT